jgi:hypothetical protein
MMSEMPVGKLLNKMKKKKLKSKKKNSLKN